MIIHDCVPSCRGKLNDFETDFLQPFQSESDSRNRWIFLCWLLLGNRRSPCNSAILYELWVSEQCMSSEWLSLFEVMTFAANPRDSIMSMFRCHLRGPILPLPNHAASRRGSAYYDFFITAFDPIMRTFPQDIDPLI